MMLLTVADVVLRAATNRPIRGMFEIVELLLACTFFIALPASFLRDEHITVDVLGPRLAPLLRRISAAVAVVVLAVLIWRGWVAARDSFVFNDVTSDLALPRYLYWAPVLAGIVGAALAAAYMALRKNGSR